MNLRRYRVAAALVAAVLLLAGCTAERDPAAAGPTTCPTGSPCPDPLASVSPSPERWREIHGLSTARQEVAAAVVEGRVFIVGGLVEDGSATDDVDRFDPADGTKTQMPRLPVKLHHAMASELDGRLVVMGGFIGGLGGVATRRVFILEGDRWREGPSLRRARGAGAAVTVTAGRDHIIVVVGGISGGSHVGPVEIFDGMAWRDGATIPSLRDHLGAATDGRLVYAVGGRRSGSHYPTFDVYDPATDRWSDLTDMPTARSGNGAAFAAGTIFSVGGEGPRIFPEVEAYDIAARTWRRLPDLAIPVHGAGVAVLGRTLFAFGGGYRVGLAPTRACQVLAIG
jgi:N-acetylneuraminic acid mutarotase